MYRAYVLYGLLILGIYGYGQYHGWSLGGGGSDSRGSSGGSNSSSWHGWSWVRDSGGGRGSWGGGYHK